MFLSSQNCLPDEKQEFGSQKGITKQELGSQISLPDGNWALKYGKRYMPPPLVVAERVVWAFSKVS